MTVLDELSRKYLWWKPADGQPFSRRRILAQIMDIGDYGDVLRTIGEVGEEPLRDVLRHVEPGWLRPPSWTYWHYRLGLVPPDEPVPPLPRRTFR